MPAIVLQVCDTAGKVTSGLGLAHPRQPFGAFRGFPADQASASNSVVPELSVWVKQRQDGPDSHPAQSQHSTFTGWQLEKPTA